MGSGSSEVSSAKYRRLTDECNVIDSDAEARLPRRSARRQNWQEVEMRLAKEIPGDRLHPVASVDVRFDRDSDKATRSPVASWRVCFSSCKGTVLKSSVEVSGASLIRGPFCAGPWFSQQIIAGRPYRIRSCDHAPISGLCVALRTLSVARTTCCRSIAAVFQRRQQLLY